LSKRLIVLLAGVLALAIAAAGCGSSDDSTDTDTASVDVTITKEQLIAQGDAICKQGNEEIEDGFESYAEENDIPKNQEPSDEQGVEIVETILVPNLTTQSELIRGLGAPEGDEEQVEELLDSLDEAIETAEDDPEALFNEDTDPFADVNQQAQDYGFSECGEE
jgi:hypothetical protein